MTKPRKLAENSRMKSAWRAILFAYLCLVLCPLQYWETIPNDFDNSWVFAVNYAAAHHLVVGRDVVWPSGPFAYLAGPMDIGANLGQSLVFQTLVWMALITILWELFFRSDLALRNLVFFSALIGMSGPLYHHRPNPLGAGNLLLTGALICLVQYRMGRKRKHYIVAMVMLGLFPLIQFVGVVVVSGIVAGLIVDRAIHAEPRRFQDIAIAAVVPFLVWFGGCWLAVGSLRTFADYCKSSAEISSGYNFAMATSGSPIEMLAGFDALVFFMIALALLALGNRHFALFFGLLLAGPLFINFKHSFVRQDSHVIYIFGFVALSTGLVALATPLDTRRARTTFTVVTFGLSLACLAYVGELGVRTTITGVTGIKAPYFVWKFLRFGDLRRELREKMEQNFSADQRVEPEIRAVLQHQPVASMSINYNSAILDGLNLKLYPVIQRYCAYTPYLDELNAKWLRDKGPRFLIFDGKSIDGRHPWTETPAMWVEAYRWYDTRLLGTHNLLLERRAIARFKPFESFAKERLRFGDDLRIPPSFEPTFWTMRCSLTRMGKLRALLFRGSNIVMRVDTRSGRSDSFRVLPAVLGSPSMGNYLPRDLGEFAEMFEAVPNPSYSVEKLTFGGPGSFSYSPTCDVELLRPSL